MKIYYNYFIDCFKRCPIGFEVQYHYYDKLKDSFDYDRDNPKILKKTFGKQNEDFSLENLAQAVMQQMARRDIFVFDVEIYEFQKKKITFKQNKSDFIIKNKKFTNTGILNLPQSDEEIDESNGVPMIPVGEPTCQYTPMPSPTAVNLVPVKHNQNINLVDPRNRPQAKQERILRYVLFSPSKVEDRVKFPYKFTYNKKYPVFHETFSSNGIGMMIDTIDDTNNRVKVVDELFIPADQNLVGGDLMDSRSGNGLVDDRLNWSGVIKDSVPKLR